jgi:hypothetical protein
VRCTPHREALDGNHPGSSLALSSSNLSPRRCCLGVRRFTGIEIHLNCIEEPAYDRRIEAYLRFSFLKARWAQRVDLQDSPGRAVTAADRTEGVGELDQSRRNRRHKTRQFPLMNPTPLRGGGGIRIRRCFCRRGCERCFGDSGRAAWPPQVASRGCWFVRRSEQTINYGSCSFPRN